VKNRIILLIEDNPDDIELTLLAFEEQKIENEIIVVRDGVEALEFLFNRGKHSLQDRKKMPIVIILDLKLPRIDGLEVLKQIRANESTRLLPVVVLTSSKEEKDITASYSLGVNSYVQKPVDFNQFTKTVKEIGLYWTTRNEPPFAKGEYRQ
jgi:two-component system, response regulator